MTYWAIIYGDPVSGFGIVGPFTSAHSADRYAAENFKADYWVVQLEAPR